MVSQVEGATKRHSISREHMFPRRGVVRGMARLGNYKKLDIVMFEGVLRDEAGARSCREGGFC